MARRTIPVEIKVDVVKRHWAGETIASLARRFGLSRETVYRWLREAEAGMRAALADCLPARRNDGK